MAVELPARKSKSAAREAYDVPFFPFDPGNSNVGGREKVIRLTCRNIDNSTTKWFQKRSPRQVFDAGNRSIRPTMEVWPGLPALAILLNLAELVLRKWKGVLEVLALARAGSVERASMARS
jgi:hypothetical protein